MTLHLPSLQIHHSTFLSLLDTTINYEPYYTTTAHYTDLILNCDFMAFYQHAIKYEDKNRPDEQTYEG